MPPVVAGQPSADKAPSARFYRKSCARGGSGRLLGPRVGGRLLSGGAMGISGRLGLGVACIGAVALVWAVSSRDPQPGPDCWRFDAGDWVAFPAGGNRPVLIVRRDTRPGTGEPVYWYRLADDSTEFVVAEAALGPRVAGLGRTWRFSRAIASASALEAGSTSAPCSGRHATRSARSPPTRSGPRSTAPPAWSRSPAARQLTRMIQARMQYGGRLLALVCPCASLVPMLMPVVLAPVAGSPAAMVDSPAWTSTPKRS